MGEVQPGIWFGKTEGKRPPESPGYRRENNIKTGLQEIVWGRGLDLSKSDVWLTVHRNSVWIRKTN